MILEPLLGKRKPDLRWEREPRFKSAITTAEKLNQVTKSKRDVFVRLRPRTEIEAVAGRARTVVRSQIDDILSDGKLVIVPKRAKTYDNYAQRTFVDESACLTFEYAEDAERDDPGEPVRVDTKEAIPLLRTEPEMFGLLFEEVDESELVIEPVKVKSKAKSKSKGKSKAKSKAEKKEESSDDKLPTPSDG